MKRIRADEMEEIAYTGGLCDRGLCGQEWGITLNMTDDYVFLMLVQKKRERKKERACYISVWTDVNWHKLGSTSNKYTKGQYWWFCMF